MSALLGVCLSICLFSVLLNQAQCQEMEGVSLADKLFLDFLPPNEAAMAIAPASIQKAETPIVVRYTLIGAVAIYDPQAACHDTALSFFGTKDPIPRHLCEPEQNAILRSYVTYRALSRDFPTHLHKYLAFLRRLGLDPISASRDTATLHGWANVFGDRIAAFFARDGWNSQGDRTAHFGGLRFQDYTNYSPANAAGVAPASLRFPLRWQPRVSGNSLGRFRVHSHVVPQLATSVRSLALNASARAARRTRGPYGRPGARRLAGADRRRVGRLVREVVRAGATLTKRRRFAARWWENKLHATAGISAYYEKAARLSRFESAQQFLGEMMAQHDALQLAWREKRRHDLARPRGLVYLLLRGERVRRWFDGQRQGPKGGAATAGRFRTVAAGRWRGLLREQAHSEFPSASAALCRASMEHIWHYVRWKRGEVGAVNVSFPRGSLEYVEGRQQRVYLAGPLAGARECARSRVDGGVHLRPAVEAGAGLGKGIGRAAFEHIVSLGEGRVPAGCGRCG